MKRWRLDQRISRKLRTHYESRRYDYPVVDVFYWRPPDGRLNFGDYLSRVVVEQAAATRGLRLDEGQPKLRRMLCIGSILHLARKGDVVWGSGINGRQGQRQPGSSRLDVRAVRGPHTRAILQEHGIAVPEVYGDPALLLPTLLPGRFTPRPTREVVFVPNLHDLATHGRAGEGRAELVSPYLPWNRVVEQIVSARLVVASSLHGLILAEAYGIPARLLRLSESEDLLKYRDYYAGTGRPSFDHATSVAQAIEMGGEQPARFDPAPLLDTFPFDLWMQAT